jgi:signal transduction histidine kinase
MVCHDLANQLTLIRLHSQGLLFRLRRGEAPVENEWASAMKQIDRIALATAAIVDDVLRIERQGTQSNAADPGWGLVDFEETLDDVLAVNAATLAQAGCSVRVSRDGGSDPIRGRWHQGSGLASGRPEPSTTIIESPRSSSLPSGSVLGHWLNAVALAR